jgi:hypothetical protein
MQLALDLEGVTFMDCAWVGYSPRTSGRPQGVYSKLVHVAVNETFMAK